MTTYDVTYFYTPARATRAIDDDLIADARKAIHGLENLIADLSALSDMLATKALTHTEERALDGWLSKLERTIPARYKVVRRHSASKRTMSIKDYSDLFCGYEAIDFESWAQEQLTKREKYVRAIYGGL
jgi:hypothetical protein